MVEKTVGLRRRMRNYLVNNTDSGFHSRRTISFINTLDLATCFG
jgi:hypothetical protein